MTANNATISSGSSGKETSCARWLYFFLTLHVIVWTALPTLVRHVLPMDALEGFVWGQHFLLGYDRNPWLNAWLTRFAVDVGGKSGWLVYFLSQFSVALCFWSVWRLGKKFLHPVYALIAVLVLEGIQYYTLASVDFNDNVLELGLWAATSLYFYAAVKEQRNYAWILTGIFAALSLMAKYYAIMLFVPMSILLLCTREGRASFRRGYFYLGMLLFILISAPHFAWIMQSDSATFDYALRRVLEAGDWQNSSFYFLGMQLLSFVGAAVLFLVALIGKKGNSLEIISGKSILQKFDKIFLLAIGFGPCLLTFLVALTFHMTMHVLWGTPLLSFWGVILIAFTQPEITKAKFYRFIFAVFVVFFAIAFGYFYGIVLDGYESSANYPGAKISNYIMHKWHEHHPGVDPKYIIGNRYVAGNLAYFVKTKPRPEIFVLREGENFSLNREKVNDFIRGGAILVWEQNDRSMAAIEFLLREFSAIKSYNKKFYWQRNLKQKPFGIMWSFIDSRGGRLNLNSALHSQHSHATQHSQKRPKSIAEKFPYFSICYI